MKSNVRSLIGLSGRLGSRPFPHTANGILLIRNFGRRSCSSSTVFDGSPPHNSSSSRRFPLHGPSEEEVKAYRTDPKTLAKWLDVSVVKNKGRAFPADTELTPAEEAVTFPSIPCSNLNGENVLLPQVVGGDVKLLVFSFKHYGFTLVRSWLDPFLAKYPSRQNSKGKRQVAIEICFVEYGFLSMAKNLFASSIKNNVAATQLDYTFLSFGGVTDFASKLLLPSVYTGYAFLLDKNNRVRWQGCGEATEDEIVKMIECAEAITRET